MEEAVKRNLTDRNVWIRLLYMVLFAVAYAVAETVLTLVVLFQFLCVLFTGGANEPVLRFGRNLGAYIRQVLEFQTFNTELRPFPFSDWPDLDPDDDNLWLDADDDLDDPDDAVFEPPVADQTEPRSDERGPGSPGPT
jgi:hypothetical protein